MKVTADLVAAVYAHAAHEQPREACGVITAAGYIPCRNAATDARTFEIAREDWAAAEDHGPILGVAHSHVGVSPEPSQGDLAGVEASGLPWLIVSWPSGAYRTVMPSGYRAPFEGREFVHGVQDCYSLLRDWYDRMLGIALPDFARENDWWHAGGNLYLEHYAEAGFAPAEGEPREHDVLLMQLRSPVPNHAAVYVGNSRILHHVQNRLSCIDVYGGFWRKSTVRQLRHARLA